MRDYKEYTILDAAGATGAGKAIYVEDFRHAIISVATDGGGDAALTVKFQGSNEEDIPDFDSAKSVTNLYEEIQVKDHEDGSAIDGDTGFSVATADDYRQFAVNTNGLRWLTANVTARSAGEVTVKVRLFND